MERARPATGATCLNEGDGFLLTFFDDGVETARFSLTSAAMHALCRTIDEAITVERQLAELAHLAHPVAVELVELPPLTVAEATVVVGAALRRAAAGDVIGFTLHPRDDGRFDWSLEAAGPLGRLYDRAVHESLGPQAGIPLNVPEDELPGAVRF